LTSTTKKRPTVSATTTKPSHLTTKKQTFSVSFPRGTWDPSQYTQAMSLYKSKIDDLERLFTQLRSWF
jgi:hypothetical protein